MRLYVKEHWRIWMLVVFVVVSSVAIFAPVGDGGVAGEATAEEGQPTASQYTNLRFGLELSGGTQVRAPLVGMTAEGLEFQPDQESDIERTLQEELDLTAADIRADAEGGTVEVFTDRFVGNLTQEEFEAALGAAGLEASNVRMGVTADTRDGVERVLQSRLDETGLGGSEARQVASPGQQFMLVEAPGVSREEVIELIDRRGQVEIAALYPDANGTYQYVTLLDDEDFRPGTATRDQEGRPYVPVNLNADAAEEFNGAMNDFGFAQQGGTYCRNYNRNMTVEQNIEQNLDGDRCLMTVLDGEVVFAAGVNSGLATSFRTGDFVANPTYRSLTTSMEEARALEIDMREGALRTTMDIENRGTSFFLQPSLAERFKPLSLLTGAAAVGAVAFVIFLRYRKPEVSAPMLLTAGAEVYILLGFAAAVALPLDLSHIAGFIAVIGTGVDDLVIIADEIMQQGEVRTSRVFESRFKKAFWVIGAAAATTIIAMSPLAVLSLGDLRGFAIVTIVGVLIGVLITRPAYGDILRILVLGDDDG